VYFFKSLIYPFGVRLQGVGTRVIIYYRMANLAQWGSTTTTSAAAGMREF